MNNFPFAGTVYRPGSCEFLLAAANCLEDYVFRYWPMLDHRIRDQWIAADVVLNNPIISYWVFKCSGSVQGVAGSLERIIHHCVDKDNMDVLRYFWPKAVEGLASKLPYLYDHTFHTTIEKGNRTAMYFVWYSSPTAYRASMISSANCCGTRNAYNAFSSAVVHGLDDVVEFLWNNTTDEQHNGMLLADHSHAFCEASSKGYRRIVDLLWTNSTKNQRFVLLYEGNCAAFRESCSEGHLDVVKILWTSADDQQRRQLLTVGQNLSFLSICANGRVEILRYLFDNMEINLKKFLVDSTLGRALNLAAVNRHKNVLEFFKFLIATPLQYKRSLFSDDFAPLKSILLNAVQEKNEKEKVTVSSKLIVSSFDGKLFWSDEIKSVLSTLNCKQLAFVATKLPKNIVDFFPQQSFFQINDDDDEVSSAAAILKEDGCGDSNGGGGGEDRLDISAMFFDEEEIEESNLLI